MAVISLVYAAWCLLNVIRPFPSRGIKTRGRAFGLLILSTVAFFGLTHLGIYLDDRKFEELRAGDPQVFLAAVRKEKGDEAYLDELKVIDPTRWEKEAPALLEAAKKKRMDALRNEESVEKAEQASADLAMKKDVWIIRGQEAVESKLKDPGSAEFRNVRFSDRGGVPMSCGEVNSKNSFGGYIGFQKYVSGGSAETTFLEEEVADFHNLWNKLC